jgi:hypothetical protein
VTQGADEQRSITANAAQAAPPPLAVLLRDPAGARTAIAINEILGRPKAFTRRP